MKRPKASAEKRNVSTDVRKRLVVRVLCVAAQQTRHG
jgi:hypothetical protein